MSKTKSWHSSYNTLNELGEGGNAKVYHVQCKDNEEEYALKDLNAGGAEKKGRFIDEINVIKDNCTEIEGIIPIFDFSIDEYWYTMSIAKPAIEYILENELNIKEIAQGIIQLCQTLEKLHEKGISHRDIKPSNIYYYKSRFYFGDFGLVEFPENINEFTKSDKGLGAIFTIAPEMKRNPKSADGKKADVFSVAKTMWMFLSKDEKGFDGVYNYLDSSHSLRYIDKYKDTHLVEIDELLRAATDNVPEIRPTIKEFKERLENWLVIYSDIDKSQASDWNFLNKQLFGSNPPESSSWRNINKIVEVLNIIGKTPAYNHMLFHDSGGLDFSHAENAAEDGCIKLYDTLGFCYIVKPRILHFEGFEKKYRWNYFLLELNEMRSIFESNTYNNYEYLVEDSPGNYVSAQYAQYGVYDYDTGTPLPKGYKIVHRCTKGKFLIVMKSGPYNGINGTYDGRHGDCSDIAFREYMNNLISNYEELYNYAKQDDALKHLSDEDIESRILNLEEFNRNPFKMDFTELKNSNEVRAKFAEQQKSKEYIKDNFNQWNFKTLLHLYELSSVEKIKFAFTFKSPSDHFSLENLKGVDNYLCTDGYIRKLNSPLENDCYCIDDRELMIILKNKLEQKISTLLKENKLAELEKYENCFSIKLFKCGKPTHLFTKKEIEEEMRKADDRFSNQLVIDEDGYAKVIKNEGFGYLFPVRHESWNAGNVYVGKYSRLSTLEDDYISSLQGWLQYLKTGSKQNMDYVHENRNEEELLKEIKEFY
ncbi:hypothetical protein psyc5s11_27230 [Clostridium gelidum]|uniref:Protein kinase domain-containing protein n=1 Tax=Clostridium gelidum TaxID=704125 RepID=A0ABM7T5X4_9CLOT|nr:protein kinase [Clostridium gelidum]BCZ46656.1 hypothetical protein psyc5s11_27230 [Clostridium gelidum]